MALINVSPQQLRRAADIQERIQALQNELNQTLDGAAELQSTPTAAPGKRQMSAAGRARIAAAARARWAKLRKARGMASVKPALKPKRRLSAAARARLSALAKARWKKAKASGKARL